MASRKQAPSPPVEKTDTRAETEWKKEYTSISEMLYGLLGGIREEREMTPQQRKTFADLKRKETDLEKAHPNTIFNQVIGLSGNRILYGRKIKVTPRKNPKRRNRIF